MKKRLLSIVLIAVGLFIAVNNVNAQCTINTTDTTAGFHMNGNSCFPQGEWSQQTWQFRNYNMLTVQGVTATVDSISIDTIFNLPCGISWTSNKKIYAANEYGCVTLYGTTNDSILTYRLDLGITAYITAFPGRPIHQRYSATTYYEYVGVVAQGGNCVLDSSVSHADSTHGCAVIRDTLYTGINDVQASLNGLSNYPNPFNGTTEIVYNATESNQMILRVYNLLGKTMHEETLTVIPGKNIVHFSRKGIAAGIYYYSLSNGKQTVTNKMVITD